MVDIQIYFLSQLDVHSPITGSVLRIERYLLNHPPHFLPRAGISPSAEPSTSLRGLRYIRTRSPGDRTQNRLPFPSELFSWFRECLAFQWDEQYPGLSLAFSVSLYIFFWGKLGFGVLGTEVNTDFGLIWQRSHRLEGALPEHQSTFCSTDVLVSVCATCPGPRYP